MSISQSVGRYPNHFVVTQPPIDSLWDEYQRSACFSLPFLALGRYQRRTRCFIVNEIVVCPQCISGEGEDVDQYVSVLVGANMSGTEKLKLLVIGKAEKPRCFKNVKTLPVDYRNNSKAWMKGDIFGLKLSTKNFTIKNVSLLIIDNCPSHPNPIPFVMTNLTVHFLPKNTTSHTQPCEFIQ